MNQTASSDELEISFWRRALRRHRMLVLTVVVLFVAVTVAAVLLRPASHSATTEVFVSGADVAPEVQFVRSRFVSEAAAAELGSRPDVDVGSGDSTWILTVTASAATPEEAARVATTYATTYVRLREQATTDARRAGEADLEQSIARARAELDALPPNAPPQAGARLENEITAFQDALTSTTSATIQAGPRPVVLDTTVADGQASGTVWLYAAAAAAIGSVAGAGLAGAAGGLDPHVPGPAYATRALRVPLFGTVAPSGTRGGWRSSRARRRARMRTAPGEVIAMIRALVLPADRDKLSGSVLVCGAGRGDGAETGRIATELATGFARAGASTALVRADFTAPEADLGAPGLSAVVAGRVALSDALTVTDDAPGLSVIAAGAAPDSTVDLLSGREFGRIVEELERTVDVVVVHCAPLGDDPGAALVSRTADATLLVVSDRTRRDELSRVEQTLHATGGRVEGIAYVGEPGA